MDLQAPKLKRALGLTSLTLYGLGTIIGAGIYVLVGAVAGRSGMGAPLAFLMAGILAALTGLSYAELGQRLPEAAGAAAYAREGFKSPLMGRITGMASLLVAMVAAASVARGGAGYMLAIVDVPLAVASGTVILLFTALACWGVKTGVYVVAAMTLVEIVGLSIVIVSGGDALGDLPMRIGEMWPAESHAWLGIMGGAFLAFFAFSGFETIVSMAEETKDVSHNLPRAIVLAITMAAVLYMLVVTIAVLTIAPADLAGSNAPLCLVVDCTRPVMAAFPFIAIIATLNGVLIEIMMMARVSYGMARRGWLPHFLSRIHAGRQTPMTATLVVGSLVFALATLIEFEPLARMTSALLLCIFLVVNVSLIRLKRSAPDAPLTLKIPGWVPVLGAANSVILLGAEVLF